MTPLLKWLFLNHWQRKLVALFLAIVIWIIVNYSMTMTKVISNIPVRVISLPPGKTIEGMQVNGCFTKISLTLTGNKTLLDDLSEKDLEVVLDASSKPPEWIANISKKNLISLNPDLDLNKAISRVGPAEVAVKQSKLVTEKIPILITHPIGEAPKGYQFLDIWPYQVYLSITGPEEAVKRLKTRGLKLTFNLNDISKTELDALQAANPEQVTSDEVSFFVPNAWKKINVPQLSDTAFEIDDPQANALRIDFSLQNLFPIGTSLPVTVFFPPKYCSTLNPETHSLATNDFIVKRNGLKMITVPLFAQGVSRHFLETVKDMIQLVIIAAPRSEKETLLWNAQFMYPHELEDRFVAKAMSEQGDEGSDVQPHLREDYLRNRFRSYMNRFRLYTPNNAKLNLKIELQANTISVTPLNYY